MPGSQSGDTKKYFGRLLLFLLSAAIAAGIFEVIVRTLFPQYTPTTAIPFYDLANGVRLGPPSTVWRLWRKDGEFDVTVRFNRHGFRDRKDYAQSSDTDWFVVGDSFAFGYGVSEEERFSDLLEQRFSRHFYNIAIPTDLRGYAALVKHVENSGVKIRQLIISICMENDLHDYRQPLASPSRRQWPPPPAMTTAQRLKTFLFENSAAYSAIAVAIHRQPLLHDLALKAGWIMDVAPRVPLNNVEKTNDIALSSAETILPLANGRKIVILLIPSRALWMGEQAQREGERLLHDIFAEILRRHGLLVVDLKADVEKSADRLRFWYREGHWNRAGHALAAQALAAALQPVSSERE